MGVYRSGAVAAATKADGSPVTRADLRADEAARAALRRSAIPCLSEEACPAAEERRGWREYWLLDPLDGTKDFLARNDEFTVNVALVRDGVPVLGVVHAPALGETYHAELGRGAHRRRGGAVERIRNERSGGVLVSVESRFHADPRADSFCVEHGVAVRLRVGSALKFCRLAEGAADVYPRFAGSSSWDTAAGHRIALEAGCRVIVAATGEDLLYDCASLRNPPFVAHGPAFRP